MSQTSGRTCVLTMQIVQAMISRPPASHFDIAWLLGKVLA